MSKSNNNTLQVLCQTPDKAQTQTGVSLFLANNHKCHLEEIVATFFPWEANNHSFHLGEQAVVSIQWATAATQDSTIPVASKCHPLGEWATMMCIRQAFIWR